MEFLAGGRSRGWCPRQRCVYFLQIAYCNSWITPIDRSIIHISRPS